MCVCVCVVLVRVVRCGVVGCDVPVCIGDCIVDVVGLCVRVLYDGGE